MGSYSNLAVCTAFVTSATALVTSIAEDAERQVFVGFYWMVTSDWIDLSILATDPSENVTNGQIALGRVPCSS